MTLTLDFSNQCHTSHILLAFNYESLRMCRMLVNLTYKLDMVIFRFCMGKNPHRPPWATGKEQIWSRIWCRCLRIEKASFKLFAFQALYSIPQEPWIPWYALHYVRALQLMDLNISHFVCKRILISPISNNELQACLIEAKDTKLLISVEALQFLLLSLPSHLHNSVDIEDEFNTMDCRTPISWFRWTMDW